MKRSSVKGSIRRAMAGLAAAAMLAPAAVCAQGGDWSKVTAAAQREGRVVWYSAAVPSVIDRIRADFQKAVPGIVLEATRITGNVIVTRADQEKQTGADGGDVLV